MKDSKLNSTSEEFALLRAGISDNANLLAEDELSELFGGYVSCSSGFCEKKYDDGAIICDKNWCPNNYIKD